MAQFLAEKVGLLHLDFEQTLEAQLAFTKHTSEIPPRKQKWQEMIFYNISST